MLCPHCRSSTTIRESRVHHECYREVTYQCNNPHCGCSFVCSLEVMREIRPSGSPNRSLRIRQSARQVPPRPYDDGGPHGTGPPGHQAASDPVTLELPFA